MIPGQDVGSICPGADYRSPDGSDRVRLDDPQLMDEYDLLFFLQSFKPPKVKKSRLGADPGKIRVRASKAV